MEDYSEYCARIREDFEWLAKASENPNLAENFKQIFYITMGSIGRFIRENGINLENPETLNPRKKKALDELIPGIKEMKSLVEEAISPVGIPISSVKN